MQVGSQSQRAGLRIEVSIRRATQVQRGVVQGLGSRGVEEGTVAGDVDHAGKGPGRILDRQAVVERKIGVGAGHVQRSVQRHAVQCAIVASSGKCDRRGTPAGDGIGSTAQRAGLQIYTTGRGQGA